MEKKKNWLEVLKWFLLHPHAIRVILALLGILLGAHGMRLYHNSDYVARKERDLGKQHDKDHVHSNFFSSYNDIHGLTRRESEKYESTIFRVQEELKEWDSAQAHTPYDNTFDLVIVHGWIGALKSYDCANVKVLVQIQVYVLSGADRNDHMHSDGAGQFCMDASEYTLSPNSTKYDIIYQFLNKTNRCDPVVLEKLRHSRIGAESKDHRFLEKDNSTD